MIRVSLWQMGLSASAFVALAALLRLTLGGRLPRRAFVALWDLAAFRFLLPFSLTCRFSPRAAVERVLPAHRFAGEAGVPFGAVEAGAHAARWSDVLPMIGLLGTLLLGVGIAVGYVRCLRRFSRATPCRDVRVTRFFQTHHTLRRVRAFTLEGLGSPLSLGVLRPAVLLPPEALALDDAQLRFVLLHELCHIRALDALRKLLLLAAVCLHWVNPLVYLMFLLASRDMELLCDERVLGDSSAGARRAYASTLLEMEARRSFAVPGSGFSKTAIEERIRAMTKMRKKSALSALLALALVCVSCVALATDGVPSGAVDEGAPLATDGVPSGAVNEGAPQLDASSWNEVYSVYAPFGLGYDEASGRLTFGGKRVRCFQDLYPVGEGLEVGTVCQFPDGEVDVYAERDLSSPIERRPDGSFDPSGVLVGLRAATQEEFDAVTRKRALLSTPQAEDGEAATQVTESGEAVSQMGASVEHRSVSKGKQVSVTSFDVAIPLVSDDVVIETAADSTATR